MPFQGGALNTIGVAPSFNSNTLQQTATTLAGQVFQGAGKSFPSSSGQTWTGNAKKPAINVALSSALGSKVVGPGGRSLSSGSNFLATEITPFVTGALASNLNDSIGKSLSSAGNFGSILSVIPQGSSGQGFTGAANLAQLPGIGGGASGFSSKTFPGAGEEPPANYSGGKNYTLGSNGSDVIFSLQPANKGPQEFGLDKAINDPASNTFVPIDSFINPSFSAPNSTADALKTASMNDNLSKAPFKSKLSSNFALF